MHPQAASRLHAHPTGGITQAATEEIAKAVAEKLGVHVNTIYKMWHDPDFDRFERMVELYLATARVDWRRAELFYQRFKAIRDAEAFRRARLLVVPAREAAAELASEAGDCAVAELRRRTLPERITEAREAQIANEVYIISLYAEMERGQARAA